MKHRFLRFLAKDADFNIFAIEACATDIERINQFVQCGEGDDPLRVGTPAAEHASRGYRCSDHSISCGTPDCSQSRLAPRVW
jgi:hypothetical protein